MRYWHRLLTLDWCAILRHPLTTALVQLVVGGLGAFWLTERWQRWRQRREFQHRTLVRFSDLSYEMMDRLAELLVLRSKAPPAVYPAEMYNSKRRDLLARWTVFVSMRGEVMAGYGRDFVRSKDYQGLFNALNALRTYVNAEAAVPQSQFEPEQETFLACREAVVANMIHAMGLLSRRDWRAELAVSEDRLTKARSQGTASSTTGTSVQ